MCANSIGFSPPRQGCHKSGLNILKATKAINARTKIVSSIVNICQYRLNNEINSFLLNIKSIVFAANTNKTEIITTTDEYSNIPQLTNDHTKNPTTEIPNIFVTSLQG